MLIPFSMQSEIYVEVSFETKQIADYNEIFGRCWLWAQLPADILKSSSPGAVVNGCHRDTTGVTDEAVWGYTYIYVDWLTVTMCNMKGGSLRWLPELTEVTECIDLHTSVRNKNQRAFWDGHYYPQLLVDLSMITS